MLIPLSAFGNYDESAASGGIDNEQSYLSIAPQQVEVSLASLESFEYRPQLPPSKTARVGSQTKPAV